ncbi:MAG: class I SAM-dependent methyltransferase [Spirochaetaceae bacterium]|nr:MAG: class I SAM-dependent methyltransferase [Spirochaetaceae bacterium]
MESYRKLCTLFYDTDKPGPPSDALEFYLGYCTRARGPVLEPMCGSGRFLVPMMERGIDIDGVDASPDMLEACRAKCRERGLSPRLFEQTIERMSLPRRYDLVILPAASFCLLTEPTQIRDALRCIGSVMLPEASLVLEIELHRNRKSESYPWTGRWVDLPEGGKIVISSLNKYDAADHIMRSVSRYDFMKDGKLCETEMESLDLRYYDRAEFQALLEETGFDSVKCAKPYSGEPPDGDETVVFECRRP